MPDIQIIDRKLIDILETPNQFGGEIVLEPLVLTLLQLRAEALVPESGELVLRRYRAFLTTWFGPGNAPLKDRLANRSEPNMVEILREFVLDEQSSK